MMIFLTGASNSISKGQSEQADASKSLGGYISSTPVPNGALNSLFDLISSYTLQKRQKETIAIGLINKFDKAVENVTLKVISNEENIASFKVSAVQVDSSNYYMESISGRYQEPMQSQFYDATFHRSSVELEIEQPAIKGEEIVLFPFNVSFEVEEGGLEGTWTAIEEAFSNDDEYEVIRITETRIRFVRRDETVMDVPLPCSYVSTGGFQADFLGELKNGKDNTVTLKEGRLNVGEAIGIWIQRSINKSNYTSDKKLVERYKNKYIEGDIENIELVISYNLVDNYDKEHYEEEYS